MLTAHCQELQIRHLRQNIQSKSHYATHYWWLHMRYLRQNNHGKSHDAKSQSKSHNESHCRGLHMWHLRQNIQSKSHNATYCRMLHMQHLRQNIQNKSHDVANYWGLHMSHLWQSECRQFASFFEWVMPLLELKRTEICSFLHLTPTCFDILSWNFVYVFLFLNFSPNSIKCHQFSSNFMPPAWKVRRGHLVIGSSVRL